MNRNYNALSNRWDTGLKKKRKRNPLMGGLLFMMLFLANFSFAQVTIPAANTNSGSVRFPLPSYFGYERSTMIYTPAEIGTTGSISSVGFYVNSLSSPGDNINVRIYMKMRSNLMTGNTTYAAETTGATLVYGPTNIPVSSFTAGSWITIPLSNPFNYTGGSDNLQVIVETNFTGGGSGETSTAKQFRYTTQSNSQYYQTWAADTSPPTGNGTRSSSRPNIQLSFGPPPTCPAPSALNATAVGLNSATLNWTCATCTGSYRVEYNTSPATFGGVGNIVIDPATSGTPISGLNPATNYTFFVRQDCGGGDLSTVSSGSFTTLTPGEDCATAATIAVAPNQGAAVNTLLTTGATSDGPAGTCSDGTGNPSKKDRWVKFVAPSSGNKIVILTSSGTLTDTVMQVWSGCPASGTAMGCNDDINTSASNFMSRLEFCQNQYTPGATYYVQVWPYSSTATGNFNIQIYEDTACPLPPSNDECAGAVTLTVGTSGSCPAGAVTGTTVDATATAGVVKQTCDQFGTYLDVMYKFNSGSNTELQLDYTNITGTNKLGLYGACGTTPLGCLTTSSTATPITGLTPNTDYYIIVWANSAAATGTFSLCISSPPAPNCVASPTAPSNAATGVNPCAVTLSWPSVSGASSYDVYLDAGAGPATTLVSPAQTGTSYAAGLLAGSTSYSWRVVPKNTSGDAVGCTDFTFTTTGAPACASLTSPADLSSTCAGMTNFSWAAAAGATSYDVYVDNVLVSDDQTGTTYSQSMSLGAHTWRVVPSNCIGSATGCVDASFTAGGAPVGDVFADPIVLGPITSSITVNGDNLAANCWHDDYTTSSTPGSSSNARPGYDVFYQFDIVECGSTLTIGTCVSSIDTYVHILDASGTRINGDDDSCSTPNTTGSLLTDLTLNAGTYYVVVEGYDASDDFGTFTLDFTYTRGVEIPEQPTVACYETATFNNTSCEWEVTGTQPPMPTLGACESAAFNTTTCAWDVTDNTTTTGSATVSVAGSYTWALPHGTGLTYTTSGTYVNTVGCNVATLNLTIIPTVNTFNIGTSCGATVSSLSVTVTAAPVAGATTYTFRLTNVNTSVVTIINRPVNNFALGNYVGVTLGTQYTVEVSTNGGANYGPACIINTPTPVSSIGAQCGTTLTSMSQFVYATYASSITGYRFRITNPATSTSVTYDALSGQNRFHFNQLPAGFAAFGTTYSVQVALRNTDGTYLPYGAGCDITTPAFPTSEVVLSQCDYTATSYAQSISAVVVPTATHYRFNLVNSASSYNQSIDRSVNTFSLNMFPGLQDGTTYTVRVAVRIGGVWGPLNGKPCNLTTPGDAQGSGTSILRGDDRTVDFKAVAYPNPFAENFMFDVQTSAQSAVQIRVYDMLGKQVENRTVDILDINSVQFGDTYPSGVYNVVISQGDNTQTVRVIKR